MNAFNLLVDSLVFVANQNMFWGSMGFTTAIAILVGVLLYDGNTDQAKKGTLAVLSYGAMILWTTFVRVFPNALDRNFIYSDGRAFATIVTIFYITIFWLLGIYIGVKLFKIKKFRL